VTRSALYTGSLVHVRNDALARRRFRYPVFVASLDLEELPRLHRATRLFSHRNKNLYSFDERDYDDAANHEALLAARGIPRPATTRLVTNLRVAGYLFNPVSFFLHYDTDGALVSAIAEVNNTFGGRHRYVLGPEQRIHDARGRIGFACERELFVSPFLHGRRIYEFWFEVPLDGPHLSIAMHVDTPAGARVFVAHLAGERRALTDRSLLAMTVRHPWMTLQVIGWIHLEALRLRLAGVPYRRPGPDHRPLDTIT